MVDGAREPRQLMGRGDDAREDDQLAPGDSALAKRVVDGGVITKHEADGTQLADASPIHVELLPGEVLQRGAAELLPSRTVDELCDVEGKRALRDVAHALDVAHLVDDCTHGQPADQLDRSEPRRL